MKPVLLFGAAFLLVLEIAAAVSVYAFAQYEPAWGRGASLQVETWLAVLGALIAMGSFGITAALTQRVHSREAAFGLGIGGAIVYLGLCWVIYGFALSAGVYFAVLLLVAISSLASTAGHRHAG